MKRIRKEDVERRACELGFLFENLGEGTVRISQPGSPSWSPVSLDQIREETCPAYMIGRESAPPLTDISSQYRILKHHRCVYIVDPAELRCILAELLNKGVSEINDAYVFSEDGQVLLYVGHHEELVRWIRNEKIQ
ncbi:MAG: hypothetical protein GX811_06815 [Lentisphaerae bacterium]|nr:hypothetical protein [Lentisphaerota bacterium]